MNVSTGEHGEIIIKKAYNGISLVSDDGEQLSICMRDSGFEFTYQEERYKAKEGVVLHLGHRQAEVISKSEPVSPDKPPIGITPRFLWIEDRLKELNQAIDRYAEADKDIPAKWIRERNELINKLVNREG
nr:hypothetical protein 47 [Balneolaceae bacterium]